MKLKTIRTELPPFSTIVVKIGSRILSAIGYEQRIAHLVEDLVALHNKNIRVILISSGAIAHGMRALNLTKRPTSIPLQQACASIGQNRLMQLYEEQFSREKTVIGQVLLTWDDLRSKKRYLNLRNTLFQLLDCKAIPIVNENDSVGVEEIQFGNNDMLGAQVALLTQADVFVNLTDVGGLFDRNPHADSSAQHIPLVKNMSTNLLKMVQESKTEISVGGMSTKLKAAEIVTKAGIYALIGDGFNQRLADVLLKPESATLFIPQEHKMSARHRWIAFTGEACGAVSIDNGALHAVEKLGKSLLAAGISAVEGSFKPGDKVAIHALDGSTVAFGLVNYSADEIRTIRQCHSTEIVLKLGRKKFDEVIHRDNLVIL